MRTHSDWGVERRYTPVGEFPWWEIVVAFWALDDSERAEREGYIDDLISVHLDAHLQEFIGGLRFVHPSAPELEPFYTLVAMTLGGFQHAVRASFTNNSVAGMAPMPPAYVVTCVNWSEESVLEHVRKIRGAT